MLGAEGAAALHGRLVRHTLQTVTRAALGPLELHGAPADDEFLRCCAETYGAELLSQPDGDLGARMNDALHDALRVSACALLVGTDCPALTARHLRLAATALHDGLDAVFVPTEDGGYALVGLRRCDPRLFERVAWGTHTVMSQTRDRLAALGWRWTELETLWDVDTDRDYERLVASRLLDTREV